MDEACVRTSARPETTKYSAHSPVDNEIKAILARPYKLATGSLSGARLTLYTADLSRAFFTSQAASRLSSVYGMRAKIVFKLQVVGTPFDSGRLKLAFQPLTFSGDTSTYSAFRYELALQLPGVELDIATQTEAQFSIPWVYPKDFMILQAYPNTDNMCLGRIGICTVLPWASGGGTAPKWTLWYWLEDVEFFGATGTPAYVAAPVSGVETLVSAANSIAAYHQACKEYPELRISTISSRIKGWQSQLGAKFPKLQAVFQPSAWLLEQIEKRAAAWGFARPLVTMQGKRTLAVKESAFAHMDSPDYSWPLTASVRNERPGVTFGADMDEMSVQYIASTWGLIGQGTVSTTSAVDALLYHAVNAPGALLYNPASSTKTNPIRSLQNTAAGTTIYYSLPTPAAFVCNCFQYWRGRVQYRVQFAKTPFHAGRIRVTILPNDIVPGTVGSTVLTGTTLGTSNYSAKTFVVDLKGENDFEFEVPWEYPTVWKGCMDPGHSVMYISCEDTVVAPSTCSSTISFNVLARILDLEVAQPIPPRWSLYPPSLIAGDVSGLSDEVEFVVIKPGEGPLSSYAITQQPVSGEATTTMGEAINSVKQLTMIQTLIWAGKFTAKTVQTISTPVEAWTPTGTFTSVTTPLRNRYIDYFASAYRAYTGGQSFTLVTTPDSLVSVVRGNTNRSEFFGTLANVPYSMGTVSSHTNQVRFKLPYQELTPVVPLSANLEVNDPAYDATPLGARSTFSFITDPTVVGGTTKHGLYSGASDDFRFYYFTCAPYFATNWNSGDPRSSDPLLTYITQ